jgi:hypothetical protein
MPSFGSPEIDETPAWAPPHGRAQPERDHDDRTSLPPDATECGTRRLSTPVVAERGGDGTAPIVPTCRHVGQQQAHPSADHAQQEHARSGSRRQVRAGLPPIRPIPLAESSTSEFYARTDLPPDLRHASAKIDAHMRFRRGRRGARFPEHRLP